MCDPVTLGIAAAATVAGDVIQNNQTQAAGRGYNTQVNAQNELLEQEFANKQNEIYNNQNAQNQAFNTMTADQNNAFNQNTNLANQKSAVLTNALAPAGNAFAGTNSDAYNQAVQDREARTAAANTAPTAYAAQSGGDIGSRVLAALGAAQEAKRGAVTQGVTNAQAQMGALSDTEAAQNNAFRGMDTGMNNIAVQSQAVNSALTSQERLPQEQINELNNVNSALIAQPYFQGPQPVYRAPNTAFATALGGIGQLAAFSGAGGGNPFSSATGASAGWNAPGAGITDATPDYFNAPGAGL